MLGLVNIHDERVVLRLCIIMAISGLTLTYLATKMHEPQITEVGGIKKEMIGETVAVKGKVEDEYISEDTLFFTLKNNSKTIQVVKFSYNGNKIGDKDVIVEGKVDEYNNELEIIAENIQES